MSPRSLELGPLELQILGLLSSDEPKGVSTIQGELKAFGNDLAYTTVMTVLSRLFEKGHVKRRKEGRQFVYLIAPEKEKARRSIFDRMRTSLFQSNRLNPILALLDSEDELTADELKELKKVVDEKLKAANK
jgi:BlaI family transcriptional regulator, penicillinase repressor